MHLPPLCQQLLSDWTLIALLAAAALLPLPPPVANATAATGGAAATGLSLQVKTSPPPGLSLQVKTLPVPLKIEETFHQHRRREKVPAEEAMEAMEEVPAVGRQAPPPTRGRPWLVHSLTW